MRVARNREGYGGAAAIRWTEDGGLIQNQDSAADACAVRPETEVMTMPADVPEPDALDQATPVIDDEDGLPPTLERHLEVAEADALDQARAVPMDDGDER